MKKRVLVCGGRDYADVGQMNEMLTSVLRRFGIEVLIEGEAGGADQMSAHWARLNGVPVLPFWADWTLFGNAAGGIRNSKQLREGKPTLCIAFPGGKGTRDMVAKCKAAGVRTIVGRWSAGPNSPIKWSIA